MSHSHHWEQGRGAVPGRPTLDFDHPASRLDRVTLMSHALWSLAAEQMGLSDEDLRVRMMELDESDGVIDHKVAVASIRCSCGCMVSANPGRCWMCGAAGDFSPFNTI